MQLNVQNYKLVETGHQEERYPIKAPVSPKIQTQENMVWECFILFNNVSPHEGLVCED